MNITHLTQSHSYLTKYFLSFLPLLLSQILKLFYGNYLLCHSCGRFTRLFTVGPYASTLRVGYRTDSLNYHSILLYYYPHSRNKLITKNNTWVFPNVCLCLSLGKCGFYLNQSGLLRDAAKNLKERVKRLSEYQNQQIHYWFGNKTHSTGHPIPVPSPNNMPRTNVFTLPN